MIKEKCLVCNGLIKGNTSDNKYYTEEKVGYICPKCKTDLHRKGLYLCKAETCGCGMSDYLGCLRKESDILSAYNSAGEVVDICKDLVHDWYSECPKCGAWVFCTDTPTPCPVCGYDGED